MTLADRAKKEVLVESGFDEHNILVYSDLETFREMYCMYAKIHLQSKYNEILIIVTQYETPDKVRQNLMEFDIGAKLHEKNASLLIVDSVKGYQSRDTNGILKLAESFADRAEKEGGQGVCAFDNMGSFFMFDRLVELLQYELSYSFHARYQD
jgi:DcmR-like sensory protein